MKNRYPHADTKGLADRKVLQGLFPELHIYGDGKGNYWFSGMIDRTFIVSGGEIVETTKK